MPFNDVLIPFTRKKRFWTDVFWLTDASSIADDGYSSLKDTDVRLSFGADGFGVSVSLATHLSYFALRFSSETESNREVAHDDQAHWMPHALRWVEVELICEAVAASHPEESEMAHPGLPLLFLCRFAPICAADDVDHVIGLLHQAWRGLGLFSDIEIRTFIERRDFRDSEYCWHYDEENDSWWIGRGSDPQSAGSVYTRRYKGSAPNGFPSKEWANLLGEAKRVVEQQERRGTTEIKSTTPPLPLRTRHGFDIRIQYLDAERPLAELSGRYFYETLDGVLRTLDLGTAEISSSSSTSDSIRVVVWGDLPRGIRVARQMLWWLRAPAGTCLSDSEYEQIPFNLAQEEAADNGSDVAEDRYLAFCKPDRLPSYPWLVSHTLADTSRDVLQSDGVLAGATLTGPTPGGWYEAVANDGGELSFNLNRQLDSEIEGTGLLVLRRVTPGVVGVLYRFLDAAGMVLLPVAIATQPLGENVRERWPDHLTVDSVDALYDILEKGAYAWWRKASYPSRYM